MALADDRGPLRSPSGNVSGAGYDPAAERMPPQDVAAEQSVLGGMLLSKDAIADVIEILRPNDFYRPAHQVIYECILDLYGRGEPADPITVSAELERRGELLRVGGAPYLHTLIATVPTAANAAYYAEIVAEKAVLRRLVEAGTRIAQLGYQGQDGADIDEIVDRAQAAIYEVTERRTSEDYAPLEELLQPTMDEIDAIASRGGLSLGVPTGFTDLDAVTNGLHPGQMIIVAARPGVGKALALDTPLPTPDGWTTMGEVRVGDRLLGTDGRPTTVVAATEVMLGRPCYRVEFSDGSSVVADADHQWSVRRPGAARGTERVHTTAELAAEFARERNRHPGRVLPELAPLQLPERALPVPPYALGAWLGAGAPGSAELVTPDPEIAMHLEGEGLVAEPAGPAGRLRLRPPTGAADLRDPLRALGVLDDPHIPGRYLRAAEGQRRALLAGLLDTAGTVTTDGSVRLVLTGDRLAEDVRELLAGLGHHGRVCRPAGTGGRRTLVLTVDEDVFRVERKRLLHKERRREAGTTTEPLRIVAVRPVPSVPVRCVQVDAPDHLYLAGRSMVPTHNSTLGLDFARSCSVKHGMTSVIFSLEMSRTEIVMRLLSAEARIRLADMRSGRMTDDDWTRLARKMSEISEAPLFVDDSPNLTMMEIRAKARRLKQRHDLKLIVVDYMQLLTSGKRVESRQQEVSEFSRNLKLLAKELEVPVVAISQLNRGPEQRTDKRPMLADLRESGCLTAATRVLRADTGAEVSLGELLASGERPLVWSLDERLRMVPRPMSAVFPSGVKEVFRLRLASGREIEATANHPFLTRDGWVPLGELGIGDRLAVPRRVPAPQAPQPMAESEVVLLAHLLGGGTSTGPRSVEYTSRDEANLRAVAEAAERVGIATVRRECPAERRTVLRLTTPVRRDGSDTHPAWADDLCPPDGQERAVPQRVFALPDEQVALFLRHLWAAGGSVRWDDRARQARIHYTSAGRRLVDDLALLLARLGIVGRIRRVRQAGRRTVWRLLVDGGENQLRFLEDVGVHGARGLVAAAVAERLRTVDGVQPDTVPHDVWRRMRELLAAPRLTHHESVAALGSRFCGSTRWRHAPSRARLARVAALLEDAEFDLLATNDVFWDEVVEITSLGEQVVYDGTVPGTHNFVANGIAVHNSLEQDADMVILIHRPDAWERDDPRMGEADLILAKHRAGPTATITVAHQLHYSRFTDLAQG